MHIRLAFASLLFAFSSVAVAQHRVVNFESAHVHPLELTADGNLLLAVNTADARLEVFTIDAQARPVASGSIAVGIDPVSVRARNGNEVWVVNQLSDTISIVDLASRRVRASIATGDKPADVVFAGTPERAYVSVAGRNQLRIFDPANLAAAPTIINLEGEEPRALARSADGNRVFIAFFESGNGSSIVGINGVNNVNGPYGGQNPPPNSGNGFSPALNPANPPAPDAAQIVRADAQGVWRDDNGRDWSAIMPGGRLHDHDVAIFDTGAQTITYADRLMTTVMALGVAPDGRVGAVGTEATNEIRFEPNLTSRFVRVRIAQFDPAVPTTKTIADLNPHLDYGQTSTTPENRAQSLGDPRAIAFDAEGRAWITGMGSNQVIRSGSDGTRFARVVVGQGPTGLVLSANGGVLYVLNKFDGSISTIDTASAAETARLAFFDPTPSAIRNGRPLLYDTHATSGLGQVACASCHIDAKSDFLAWDLGNPSGDMKSFNQTCRPNQVCDDWHPMKGPMVTQVLSGIVGNGAMHWRGDRESVAAFAPAFVGLQGRASEPSAADMARLEAFLANVAYPPNPNRNADGSLVTTLNVTGGSGNPVNGQSVYINQPTLGPTPCVGCHSLPNGTSGEIDNPMLPLAPQPQKVAQLRGLTEKVGWNRASNSNRKGFGFNSDSEFDTLFALLGAGFNFGPNNPLQLRRDVEAFLLSFDTGTHAAVGQQILFNGANNDDATLTARLASFKSLADAGSIGLIAKARVNGAARGYVYATQNVLLADREHAPTTLDALRAAAALGSEVVFTVVPAFTQYRAGVDRDGDGWFDTDETDHGANGTDATSTPTTFCRADFDGDGTLAAADADAFHAAHAAGNPRANWDWSLAASGLPSVDAADLTAFDAAFAQGCTTTVFGNGFE